MTGNDINLLAAAFRARTLPKTEWTHRAHLIVGAWHVHKWGRDGALVESRNGIRLLNDTHGVPNSESRGYHETITRCYLVLIEAFFRQHTTLVEAVSLILRSPLA